MPLAKWAGVPCVPKASRSACCSVEMLIAQSYMHTLRWLKDMFFSVYLYSSCIASRPAEAAPRLRRLHIRQATARRLVTDGTYGGGLGAPPAPVYTRLWT